MDLDVGAQRAAELLNCLTVVTFTSNKYHVLHGTRAILTWLIQCTQLSDDLDEGLYRLLNHIARADTPAPVTAASTQLEKDQYAWWNVLYLLPRWLLWSSPT